MAAKVGAGDESSGSAEASVRPEAGSLTAEEMSMLIRHLPAGISYSDEHGVLRYWCGELFADCSDKWIGRHVNDCHAKAYRPMIDRIDAEFRAGTKNEAAFWKYKEGRLVLSRYFAVRDGGGAYRGILETFEDVTDLQGLEGEQLTLDW
jgi:uncharacterized protein